jgi:hypothetical protein
MAGGTVFDLYHNESRLPDADAHWKRVVRMASDVALGMSYLHARIPAIIHRDLKSPK